MDEWYYAENGESVGPVGSDVVRRIVADAGDAPQLVWSPGMPDWVDGRGLPQFARKAAPAALPFMDDAAPEPAAAPRGKTLLKRARHEMIAYAAISAYLMVWFTALMFYKTTILRGAGVDLAPFGIAAILKSLILGKFILVLEAVHFGERQGKAQPLIVQIVLRALVFTLALAIMTAIEEVVVGYFHGHAAREALRGIAAGSPTQVVATAILMFLVLVPYLAFRRLAEEFGELPELLFTRRAIKKAA
jgi:hypothetical protein